jgi:hypothetical protein
MRTRPASARARGAEPVPRTRGGPPPARPYGSRSPRAFGKAPHEPRGPFRGRPRKAGVARERRLPALTVGSSACGLEQAGRRKYKGSREPALTTSEGRWPSLFAPPASDAGGRLGYRRCRRKRGRPHRPCEVDAGGDTPGSRTRSSPGASRSGSVLSCDLGSGSRGVGVWVDPNHVTDRMREARIATPSTLGHAPPRPGKRVREVNHRRRRPQWEGSPPPQTASFPFRRVVMGGSPRGGQGYFRGRSRRVLQGLSAARDGPSTRHRPGTSTRIGLEWTQVRLGDCHGIRPPARTRRPE